MGFTIATWNVNSLRVRLPQVLAWLEMYQPTVLALQETKLPDENFPVAKLQEAGYHVAFNGQRTYNGVALLSRMPLHDIVTDVPELDGAQRRLLAATVGDKRIINLYVPNGESTISDKYQYKLTWLKTLTAFLQAELNRHDKVIILGDFNIAPEDRDVHDPALWEGKVLCSAAERQALQEILQLGFSDSFRLQQQPEKSFSWWDYRLNAFKRNMGLRIDHILISPALRPACLSCAIDKEPRSHERPSDHAPVVATFSA